MTSAWGYIARATIRRRWVGIVLTGLVVGAAAGGVIAVGAAAGRTDTAYDRLAAATLRYDVAVQDDTDGAPVIDPIATLPNVVAVDRLAVYFGLVGEESLLVTGGTSGQFGHAVDRPVVLHGRLPDPAADDELLLNEEAAETFRTSVGDTIDVATMSPEQFEAVVFGGQPLDGAPGGPTLHLEVVGIGKIPDDLDRPDAASITTPRVIEGLTGTAGGFDNLARVRLDDEAHLDEFTADVADLPGYRAEQVYLTLGGDDGRRVSDATRVEAVSTTLLALAAGLALAFVVGLVIARSGDDALPQRALAACGLDRRARALVYGVPLALIGVVAALTAAPIAIALSPLFPIGLAGAAEPDPGLDVDVPNLLAGIGLLLLVVVLAAAATAWRASGTRLASTPSTGGRANAAPGDAVARSLRLGPASAIGVRLALSPGRGPTAVPARSAILSLVVGVAGVTAVLVFAASLDQIVATPAMYGVVWDLTVSASDDPAEADGLREALLDDSRVEGLLEADVRQVEIGDADVPIAALTTQRGTGDAVYLGGRPPSRPDEIALGPLEQRDLGVSLGDPVTLPGPEGEVTVTVVGTVLVPVEDDESGRGATMTAEGLQQTARSGGFSTFLVDLAPGTDVEAFAADLGADSEAPRQPTSIENLARAKGVPRLLAAFLAILGVAGVLHALAVTSRRRRLDLWTLRAVGFHRGQLRALFGWQAATIALVGVTIGLALGIAAGRSAWRVVAHGLGVVTDPADITTDLLGGGLATVVVLTVTGTVVGMVAARGIVARPPRQE
jgi:hypothetical protein